MAKIKGWMQRNDAAHELVIGETYFVDNPQGKSYVGRLVAVIDPFTVALTQASWVANTGRFHEFMRDGKGSNMEVEPAGDVPRARYQSINRWPHKLFEESV